MTKVYERPQKILANENFNFYHIYITYFNEILTIYVTYFTSISRHQDDLIWFMTLIFIFVSLGLQTTHSSHGKNDDVTNLLSCDITPICFTVRTYTNIEISLPLVYTFIK